VAFEAYVSLVADALTLRDWDIRVDWDSPCSSDAIAEILSWPHQRRATVHVGQQFAGAEPRDQRQTVVHELIHCHLFALHAMSDEVVALLAKPAARLASKVMTVEVERVTDALADAFSPTVPVPEIAPGTVIPKPAPRRTAGA